MVGDQTQTGDVPVDGEDIQGTEAEQTIDYEKAQRGVRLLLESIGQDPDRGALSETWERRVPDALETLSEGYRSQAKPALRTFESDATELVIKSGIPFQSLCEHHLLPFTGTVTVAYRPAGSVVGLSKLTRYVRWKSRRLTVQEELTTDIADGLAAELDADVVLVGITATHLCEVMRGIETTTETQTTAIVGTPTDDERARFRAALE